MEPQDLEPCSAMGWSHRTRVCPPPPPMGQHPGIPVPSFRGTPLEAGKPVARPDCLPQELIALNPASYHLSVSHSRLRALPGPLSLILFLPVFLSFLP